jgi:thiamine kinase-like enzyme
VHPTAATFDDPMMIAALATNLRKLHNGPSFVLSWDIFNHIRNSAPDNLNKDMEAALIQLDEIEDAMKRANFLRKPTHNDIHSGNLLVYGNEISLIDWGDGGMGDPYYDLACSSVEFAFDSRKDEELLFHYTGNITELAKSRLLLMKHVFILKLAFLKISRPGKLSEDELQTVLNNFIPLAVQNQILSQRQSPSAANQQRKTNR